CLWTENFTAIKMHTANNIRKRVLATEAFSLSKLRSSASRGHMPLQHGAIVCTRSSRRTSTTNRKVVRSVALKATDLAFSNQAITQSRLLIASDVDRDQLAVLILHQFPKIRISNKPTLVRRNVKN